jgi:L,D-transpeptidase catalytic domain
MAGANIKIAGTQPRCGGYSIGKISIYDFQSRGCIRMHPEDAGTLFRQVKVGQRREIIYEPVLLAQLQNGEILLEVHRDPYRKKSDSPLQFVRRLAGANDLAQRIDWGKATEVGVPAASLRFLTLRPALTIVFSGLQEFEFPPFPISVVVVDH